MSRESEVDGLICSKVFLEVGKWCHICGRIFCSIRRVRVQQCRSDGFQRILDEFLVE
ncbi:MAG: hypothetical protein QXE57_05090 [Nitrososphaerales archaeon]